MQKTRKIAKYISIKGTNKRLIHQKINKISDNTTGYKQKDNACSKLSFDKIKEWIIEDDLDDDYQYSKTDIIIYKFFDILFLVCIVYISLDILNLILKIFIKILELILNIM